MVLKVITIDLLIPGCSSLKEKRFVLTSIKTKLRRRYNVSVAEIDYHDKWQRSKLAVATVGSDRRIADSCIDKVLNFIEGNGHIQVVDCEEEFR